MNPQIQDEILRLKLYLKQYPHTATELAVVHLEDYLVLVSQYDQLQAKIKQLSSADSSTKKANITRPTFVEAHLTLEQQFRVEKFQRYLTQNQNNSEFWAITYFHNYLILVQQYQKQLAVLAAQIDRSTSLKLALRKVKHY